MLARELSVVERARLLDAAGAGDWVAALPFDRASFWESGDFSAALLLRLGEPIPLSLREAGRMCSQGHDLDEYGWHSMTQRCGGATNHGTQRLGKAIRGTMVRARWCEPRRGEPVGLVIDHPTLRIADEAGLVRAEWSPLDVGINLLCIDHGVVDPRVDAHVRNGSQLGSAFTAGAAQRHYASGQSKRGRLSGEARRGKVGSQDVDLPLQLVPGCAYFAVVLGIFGRLAKRGSGEGAPDEASELLALLAEGGANARGLEEKSPKRRMWVASFVRAERARWQKAVVEPAAQAARGFFGHGGCRRSDALPLGWRECLPTMGGFAPETPEGLGE